MNTPNPLLPQGSLPSHAQGKSTLRIAVFSIIAVHAVFFAGILMQGCKPENPKVTQQPAEPAAPENELPKLPETSDFYTKREELPQPLTATPQPAPNVATPPPEPAYEPAPQYTPPPPSAPAEPAPDLKQYTVVRHDSFWKIAKANGVTVGDLARANPEVDPSRLKPGQKIQIPPATAAPKSSEGTAGAAGTEGSSTSIHTVRAGETLTKIARQHGVTVKALKSANNLRTDRLSVGQKLKLPPPEPTRSSPSSALTGAGPKMSSAKRGRDALASYNR